ncbi:MAG: transglycosylase domain-containing protein [Alphaproteobacteria bacterium]|jgi:penicillin-binding protein 1A
MILKKQSKNKKEKKQVSWKLRLLARFVSLMFFCFVAIVIYVFIVFLQMPSLDSMLNETRQPSITFIDKNGYEIRSVNKIMGAPVSVKTLPAYVWQSIVAIEDKRFFNHGAVDFIGLLRATITNLHTGRIAAGGSSLTQQTAKNIFLSPRKTIKRKVQEVLLAYWLENRFSKQQILDLYMNRVSLVRGMRGIDAAARDLFQKPAKELTLAESVQIAAMLKAPTTYSPVRNPEKNIARAKIILKEMVRQKYISLDDARSAAANLYAVTPVPNTNVFRYWTDFVLDEMASRMGDEINSDLFVYTTLDQDLHEHAAAVVRRSVDDCQSAVVAMERDGAIRALVGGIDYQESQFNRALAPRQPGSAFKPVVYLVALENGMQPTDIVNDSEFEIGDYKPKNYNEKYYGDITLVTAFAKSVNSVPLKLTRDFGIDSVLQMAGRLGFGAKLRREYSTVLGACEISLLDLTAMNTVIWNGGQSIRPYGLEKIITANGKIIYERNPSDSEQMVDLETIKKMQELLGAVVQSGGTGTRAAASNVLGGKTGTSNDNRDAWFIGATDKYVIGVWVGNDDNSPMDKKITGGTIPAEIFKNIIK